MYAHVGMPLGYDDHCWNKEVQQSWCDAHTHTHTHTHTQNTQLHITLVTRDGGHGY